MKHRRDRRSGMPRESWLLFYPKLVFGLFAKQVQWASTYLRLRLIYRKIKQDSQRMEYRDLALTPVTDDETETMELFQSDVAQAFVGQQQRLAKMRWGEAA